MAHHRFPAPPYDQINLTSLIDTLFFLLIIFMITAPILEYNLNVSPPKMKASDMKPDDNSHVVNVTKNGDIMFEKHVVSMQVLLKRLGEMRRSVLTRNSKIYLRADKELRYGVVIDVMKTIKDAGFEDILLVTADDK